MATGKEPYAEKGNNTMATPCNTSQSFSGRSCKDKYQEKYIFKTPFGLNIYVYCGDITTANVDAVTTGEGSVSSYMSSVTRQLLRKLGRHFDVVREKVFQADPVEGQAYISELPRITRENQKYRYIIHACVPHYHSKSWEDLMEALYMNVCIKADERQLGSVAIPLLGAGAGCADTYGTIKAAAYGIGEFGHQREHSSLKQVHIVTYEPSLLQAVCDVMQEQLFLDEKSTGTAVSDIHSSMPRPNRRNRVVSIEQENGNFVHKKERDASKATQEPVKSSKTKPFVSQVSVTTRMESFRHENAEMSHKEKSGKVYSDHVCPICMDKITDPKELPKCKHVFCRHCIDTSFKMYKPVCPSCQTAYGEIIGNMPQDGIMDVQTRTYPALPGHDKYGTIIITYRFPDGMQTVEHPKPGVRYHGTIRTAYLPNSPEGQRVLQLLEVAWKRRLTFTVGRSTTTGQDNVVTWNDIHHKTSITGGESHFGYPDDTYLSRVKEELASKGVTEADLDYFQ